MAAVVVAPPPLLPLSTVVPVTSHSPRLPGLTPSLPLTPYHPLHSPLHGLTSSLLPILTVYYITTYLLLPIWSQPAIVGASITYLTLLSTIVLLPIMNTRYIVIYIYSARVALSLLQATFPSCFFSYYMLLYHVSSTWYFMCSIHGAVPCVVQHNYSCTVIQCSYIIIFTTLSTRVDTISSTQTYSCIYYYISSYYYFKYS